MKPKWGLEWQARLHQVGSYAEKFLEVLPHLSGGNHPVQRVAGLASGLSKIMSAGSPDFLATLISRGGFVPLPLEHEVQTLIFELLRTSDLPVSTMKVGDQKVTLHYESPGDKQFVLAAVYGAHFNTLYVRKEYDLSPLVSSLVWSKGDSLMLTAKQRNWSVAYSIKSMEEPGSYIGSPSPQHFINRLRKVGSKATRSLLLVGPTGSGKSTLARLISQGLTGTERTLKVSSDALRMCTPDALIDLLALLQPNVLLLDDIPVNDGFSLQKLLALYEALYGKAKLIITTYMEDEYTAAEGKDGSLYWSGMRPGRIDEVYRILRPDLEQRKAILAHYLDGEDAPLDALADATTDLTGAYLAEVAYRLRTFGVEGWQDEVAAVRSTAPIRPASSDGDKDPPKDGKLVPKASAATIKEAITSMGSTC